jgi:hypothetical protein
MINFRKYYIFRSTIALQKNKEARNYTVLNFKNDLLFLNFTFTNLSLIQTNQQQESKQLYA